MFRLTTICVIAMSTAFVSHIAARGRSFPIEVTGAIVQFNRTNQTFTIQVDEPARTLIIAVGRDCKFKREGAPAGKQILKPSARVKVRYFATIFTGNIAVEVELNPAPEVKTGTIERIEPADRKLEIRGDEDACHLVLRWTTNCRFLKRGKIGSAADLRENTTVRASYYSPAFASKYALKIELEPGF